MAHNKHHVVGFRRKQEGKTDYALRLSLLKSRKHRLVVRKSLHYITAQIIDYDPKGDKIIASVNSKSLAKLGWNYAKNNVPAAYLTGLLLGTQVKGKVQDAIVDIGRNVSKKESRLYAVVKGAIDAGMNIPVSDEILPSDDRVSGAHVAAYATDLAKDKVAYNKLFSGYTKAKAAPENMPKVFETVKKSIMK